jgi:glycosyltransferase involved in cell wall biosynthesis
MNSPKVSVVIPAFNVKGYIWDTLSSLSKQSFQSFEALVVNDGSTDDTPKIIKAFCQTDSRFHLLEKPNGGLSSARNYGIKHAQGEYIAMLDADDLYERDKLKTHVAILDRHPNVGVVYSASRAIRDDGQPTMMVLSGKPIYKDPLRAMLCKNFIGHGSNSVFRRQIVDEIGDFDETLRSSEDSDFWLRIAATGHWKFYRVPQPLSLYRVRPSGLSFNVAQMQQSYEQVLESALQRSPKVVRPLLPTAYAYLYRYLARVEMTSGNIPQARAFIQRALKSDGSIFLRDPRSLLTLVAVQLSPLAGLLIKRSLGSAKLVKGKNA